MLGRKRGKDTGVGQRFETNGSGVCEILEYKNSRKVTIKFLNTGTVVVRDIFAIRSGEVKDTSIRYKPYDLRPGTVWNTRRSGKCRVLEYKDCHNVTVKFLETGNIKVVHSTNLREMRIRDNGRCN